MEVVFADGHPGGLPGYPGGLIQVVNTQIAQNVYVLNNLFYDTAETNVTINNSGSNFVVANNVFGYFGEDQATNLQDGVVDESNLTFEDAQGFAALSLVDPANGAGEPLPDFHPTPDSAALIDAGYDPGDELDFDADGAPRPMGDGFDIGPYEQ